MPQRRMDMDARGIERIPVDAGMGDPLERHRHRSPDRYGRGMLISIAVYSGLRRQAFIFKIVYDI